MKHNQLRSIGHNIADSMASGTGLLIGFYIMNIFSHANESQNKYITIDFLNGIIEEDYSSDSLINAVKLYHKVLPDLCQKQGCSITDFRKLTARYSSDRLNNCVSITIEDKNGRCSTDEYCGSPLKRLRILDTLGRIRKKPKTSTVKFC